MSPLSNVLITNRIHLESWDPIDYKRYTKDTSFKESIDLFSTHLNFDTIPYDDMKDFKYEDDPSKTPTSLEQLLRTDVKKDVELNAIYTIVDVLRSYIDMFHDFLHYGDRFVTPIREEFEKNVLTLLLETVSKPLKAILSKFYNDWKELLFTDKSIFTASGNVNQTACQQQMDALADAYIKLLHDNTDINWIHSTNAEAYVGTYNSLIPEDVTKLVEQLQSDGINEVYVESANSNIGQLLKNKGMRVVWLDVSQWDAGSGYGSILGKTINTSIGKTTTIPTKKGNKVEKKCHELKIPPSIVMFGYGEVSVSADNTKVTISHKYNPAYCDNVSISGPGPGPKPKPVGLSLNSVLKAIGLPTIRGECEAKSLIVQPTSLTPKQELLVAMLKTWTDTIQIRTLSLVKESCPGSHTEIPKIATVISDNCCKIMARMQGLCVLHNAGKNITYYNYDANYGKLTPETIERKCHTLLRVCKNIDRLKVYINNWFDIRIKRLDDINKYVPDPTLYFCSLLLKGIYELQKESARIEIEKIEKLKGNVIGLNALIKGFPSSITNWLKSITNSESIVADFAVQFSKFNELFVEISKINSRQNNDIIGICNTLMQFITNTIGPLIKNKNQLHVITATTIGFIFFRNYQPDTYADTIIELIGKLKKNEQNEQNADTIQILRYIESILLGLVNPFQPEWTVNKIVVNNSPSNTVPKISLEKFYINQIKNGTFYMVNFKNNSKNGVFHHGFKGILNRAYCIFLAPNEIPDDIRPLCEAAKAAAKAAEEAETKASKAAAKAAEEEDKRKAAVAKKKAEDRQKAAAAKAAAPAAPAAAPAAHTKKTHKRKNRNDNGSGSGNGNGNGNGKNVKKGKHTSNPTIKNNGMNGSGYGTKKTKKHNIVYKYNTTRKYKNSKNRKTRSK